MLTAIIDYESGNLHSAQKAFERMAREMNAGDVVVTSDPEVVARAERLVLPGDGAFPACRDALKASAVYEAMVEAVQIKARPFMGICVGMQLMALRGFEYMQTEGLGWVDGEVIKITPNDVTLKVPHMGWNDLVIDTTHPVLNGVSNGDHVYFVHSYHMKMHRADHRLAHVEYGGDITAIVGCDTMIGLQFHPEKSADIGLRMIGNFLTWTP